MKVSWQITGIRQDANAKAHPIEVEAAKDETERGSHLTPEAYGLDETRSVKYARDPEMVKERMVKEKEQKQPKEKEQITPTKVEMHASAETGWHKRGIL